jgi:hypothetical protein
MITRDTIKAIPTKYSGVIFRSKMESLFARWCDEYRQKWIYEPEGLTNGKDCYLPDFLLPDSKMIVEIKPALFIEETFKLDMLIKDMAFDKLTIAVIEPVHSGKINDYWRDNHGINVIKFSDQPISVDLHCDEPHRVWEDKDQIFWGFCQECGAFGICGNGSWACKGCGYYDGDNTIL